MSDTSPYNEHHPTRFERWWERDDDPDGNFTRDEIVWKEARKDLLREQRKRRKKRNAKPTTWDTVLQG
jgi:ferric-dicitrate binding protein FerR (iron transport regulator)